ncbi:MAG: DUF2752 domain-containing protein [Chloroflexi bacterium]|nr:DUF2752 domain-containing protein [Chloroflexota bacterium]
MNQSDTIPPLLAHRRTFYPAWLFLGMVAAAAFLQIAVRWNLPLPQCGFRQWTGAPCPFCGSARALLAWSHLDVGTAFCFNPLAALLCAGIGLWFVLWAGDRLLRTRWQTWAARQLQQGRLRMVLAVMVLVNWLYVLLSLPR